MRQPYSGTREAARIEARSLAAPHTPEQVAAHYARAARAARAEMDDALARLERAHAVARAAEDRYDRAHDAAEMTAEHAAALHPLPALACPACR